MIMTLKGNLTGKDVKTSKKGNNYKVFAITQGIDVMQLMLSEKAEAAYDKIALYKPIEVKLDYSPRWRSFIIDEVISNA